MAPYVGLDRFEARKRIVDDLQRVGRAGRGASRITRRCRVSSRSHAVIEPLLSLQWFVTHGAARAAGARGVPQRPRPLRPRALRPHLRRGLENIRDWNISRQIWWGHQLPVWYTPDDDVVVAHDEDEARAHRARAVRHRRAAPRSRHARHLVLLGAVAVLDPGLARADARARALVSQPGDGHQPRHHLLVGGAHGDARACASPAASRSRRCSSRRWCSTCTAARCPSRSATRSIR